MKRFWMTHALFRKLIVMILMIVVFIIGKYIPLPFVPLDQYLNVSQEVSMMTGATGGDLSQVGLFSLGLGPYMYATLLSQLFMVGKGKQNIPPKVLENRKNMLMLVIALIQGLSMAVSFVQPKTTVDFLKMGSVTILLVTGAFVISWLGNMNTAFGLGGSMPIIVANILLTQLKTMPLIVQLWGQGFAVPILLLGVWILVTMFAIVIFERSEYRVPVQRISIHNDYAKGSYIPIKVNISGGMPLMYAYTFLVFPQYIFMLLHYFRPDWKSLDYISDYFTTGHIVGIAFYLFIIVILTLSLAHVNIDPQARAEQMRNSGDFISGVRPGKPTRKYLASLATFFGWFNGLYLVILSGVPLIVTLGHAELQSLANIVGIFMMFTGMVLTIKEEVSTIRLKKIYQSIF